MKWGNVKQFFALPRTRRPAPEQQRTVYVPLMQAGVRVDHETAMTYAAVYAAVRVITETVAVLPWHVFRLASNGNRERVPTSPVERVLNTRPNPEMSPMAFRETLLAWALTWGNGYAEIERDGAGRVMALWPMSPDRVDPERDENGSLVYGVRNPRGEKTYLPASSVYHLHGLGFNGLTGYSVISLAAKNIGLGLAAEEFAGAFFANGTVLSGVVEHPGKLGDDAFKHLTDSLKEKHQGPQKAHKTQVFEEGMKWHQVGVPPEDAQLIESRKLSVTDIARWFRVPPHKLADLERATFTNIEHQDREFVTNSILPWTVRMEEEANFKLFSARANTLYTKLNINALMRGDSQARAEFYQKMAGLGVFSINKILELEDMDTIGPEGDKRLVPMNLTTLDKVGMEQQVPETESLPAPQREAHMRLMVDGLDRIIRKEARRAEGAVQRYETREELASWMDDFLGGSTADSMRDFLMPSCTAFASVVGAPEHACSMALAAYVPQHLRETRDAIWALHDGDGWPADRGVAGAEFLINRISEYALTGTIQ